MDGAVHKVKIRIGGLASQGSCKAELKHISGVFYWREEATLEKERVCR